MTLDPAQIALLEEWLQGKEGEHLEFKEWKTKDDFELLCKYCCALANEGGGRFIMGPTADLERRWGRSVSRSTFRRIRPSGANWMSCVRCFRLCRRARCNHCGELCSEIRRFIPWGRPTKVAGFRGRTPVLPAARGRRNDAIRRNLT